MVGITSHTPILLMEEMRDKIISGHFDPDAKRGGRWENDPAKRTPIMLKVEDELGMSIEQFMDKLGEVTTTATEWEEGQEENLEENPILALLDAVEEESLEEEAGDHEWVVPDSAPAQPATPECLDELSGDEFKEMSAVSQKRFGFAPRDADTDLILRHEDYRTVHWGHKRLPDEKLGCGKRRGPSHKVIQEIPVDHWPFCGSCFPV